MDTVILIGGIGVEMLLAAALGLTIYVKKELKRTTAHLQTVLHS